MEGAAPLCIVHIVAPGTIGGTESVIRGLAIGHHRMGHRVHVIGVVEPRPGPHPYLRALAEGGVVVHELQVSHRGYLKERRLVRGLLSEIRPDIVHTHGYRPDMLDGPIARALHIPTVTTLHGSSFIGGTSAILEWVQLRLLGRCDAVIAVSRKIVEELRQTRVPPERVHCIPNGWVPSFEALSRQAARAELGLGQDGVVVGWVARLIPIKACDVFLRGFAACRGTPAVAAIIGDGPERAMLEALAQELGIASQVRFCGARDHAGRLMRAFDAFVISSRSEGTPIALLEALSAEVPVVTTAVGGIPDVVSPAEALLVPSEDPAALGHAILGSLRDPEAARRRAQAARARLDGDFGAERWLARHEALYRSLLPR